MASGPYMAWSRGRLTFPARLSLCSSFRTMLASGLLWNSPRGLRPGRVLSPGDFHIPLSYSAWATVEASLPQKPRVHGSCHSLDCTTSLSAVDVLGSPGGSSARAGNFVLSAAVGPVPSMYSWGSVNVCRTSDDSGLGSGTLISGEVDVLSERE